MSRKDSEIQINGRTSSVRIPINYFRKILGYRTGATQKMLKFHLEVIDK